MLAVIDWADVAGDAVLALTTGFDAAFPVVAVGVIGLTVTLAIFRRVKGTIR